MDNNPSLPNKPNDKKRPTTFGLPKQREKVIDLLEKAFINNDLDSDDYESRLVMAHGAQSIEELKVAIHDFPQKDRLFPSNTTSHTKVPSARSSQLPSPVQGFIHSIENADAMSVIGDCHVTSMDVHQPNLKVIRGIGNTVLDMRDIGHKFSHVRIESYGLIGDVYIRVPVNAKVKRKMFVLIGEKTQRIRNKAQSFIDRIFGNKKNIWPSAQNSSAPEVSVEITGFNLIGNLVIEYYQDE